MARLQGKERRRHPRVPGGDLPLLLRGDARTPLRIRDLSHAGVAFFSENPMDEMTRVRFAIEFRVPGQASSLASGEGIVVRCQRLSAALDHYEVALFFHELDPGSEALVDAWVQNHLSDSSARSGSQPAG
ncbi:MAG: PilZ domain-containing protein [Planctomycetota bacterium]